MSANVKLGVEAFAYLNTNVDGDNIPDNDSPTWTEITGVSDFTPNETWDVAEIIERGSRVKKGAKTTLDIGFTGKIRKNENSATFVAIREALRSPDNYVDLLILDGPIDEVGSVGIRADYQITDGGGSQNPGDVLYTEFKGVPYPTDNDCSYVEIEVASVLTEVAI